MKKFDFRLDKVLDYRRLVEEWARDAYLEARAQRLEADVVLLGLKAQRQRLLRDVPTSIEDAMALDLRLSRLDDEERRQQIVVQVLATEEEKTLGEWREKKAEAEAIVRLRENAYQEWMREMNRLEQADLDEWAVQRRAA